MLFVTAQAEFQEPVPGQMLRRDCSETACGQACLGSAELPPPLLRNSSHAACFRMRLVNASRNGWRIAGKAPKLSVGYHGAEIPEGTDSRKFSRELF